MTKLKKKIEIKTLVAWSIFKDVQDQKHIIKFVWPYKHYVRWMFNGSSFSLRLVNFSSCGVATPDVNQLFDMKK